MTTPQQPAQPPQGNPPPRHPSLRPRPLASRRDASQQTSPDHAPASKRARPNTPANAGGRANTSGQRVVNTGVGANGQAGGGRQQAGVGQTGVNQGVAQAGVHQAGVKQESVNQPTVNPASAAQANANHANVSWANANQAHASHANANHANANHANANHAGAAQPGINPAGGAGANPANFIHPDLYHIFQASAEKYSRCNIAIFRVGPSPVKFHVDIDHLLVRSPNFHRFCMVECAERSEQHKPRLIHLPDVCPTTFSHFLKWMGNSDPFGGRPLPDLAPFLSLWRFSERFQCFLLQSDLLAYLHRWLGKHRGLFGVSVIRLVYTMFERDSHMRKMVVEVNAWRSGLADFQNSKADVPREYVEDLAEALLSVRRTDPLTGLPGDFVARYMPTEEEKVDSDSE